MGHERLIFRRKRSISAQEMPPFMPEAAPSGENRPVHLAQTVPLVPEASVPRPESAPVSETNTLHAEVSQQVVTQPINEHEGFDPEYAQKRLMEIQKEENESIIPIGPARMIENRYYRNTDDLADTVPIWKTLVPGSQVLVDIAIIDHEDGSRTQFVDRHPGKFGINRKSGAYEETYVRDEKGKLKLHDRKRIGEGISFIYTLDQADPSREPHKFFYVATEKTLQLEREKAEIIHRIEIEQNLGVTLGTVAYEPTEKELQQIEKGKEDFKKTLNLIKESPQELAQYGGELLTLNLLGSGFFWGFPLELVPGGHLTKLAIVTAMYSLGGAAITKLNDGPFNIQSLKLPAMMTGVFLSPLLLSPILGAAAVVAPIVSPFLLPVLSVGALGAFGYNRWKHAREFNAFAKKHPEITDKKELNDMLKQEKKQEKVAKKQEEQIKKLNASKAEHKMLFDKLKVLNPNVADAQIMEAIKILQKDFKAGRAQAPEVQYAVKSLKLNAKPLLVQIPLQLAMYGSGFLLGLPAVPVAVTAAVVASWIGLYLRQRGLRQLKTEIKENHPELLPKNGKK